MKKCPYCGSELADNASYCFYCMHSLSQKKSIIPKKRRPRAAIAAVTVFSALLLAGGITALVLFLHKAPDTPPETVGTESASDTPTSEPPAPTNETILTETLFEDIPSAGTPVTEVPSDEPTEPIHEHSAVTDEGYAATCTEKGLSSGSHCAVCGEILKEQEELPKLGHSYSALVNEPTCEKEGYTEHICERCGDSYTTDKKAATGHAAVTDAGYAATCTEKGLSSGSHCAVCGKILKKQEELSKLGHSYSATVVEPTCEKEGYTEHICDRCGDSYTTDKKAATGHTAVTDVGYNATCTEKGLSYGSHCSVCKKVFEKQETIPALGHNYYSTVVYPTREEEGYTENYCLRCGDSTITNRKAATGHTPQTVPAVAPDCETTGLSEGSRCAVCGKTLTEQNILPSLGGHDFVNGYCSRCGSKEPSEGLAYTLNTKKDGYALSGIGSCTDSEIVVPAEYNGLPVTEVTSGAFQHCNSFISIVLPDSVRSIGNAVFYDCTSLVSVTFGKNLSTVGSEIFLCCRRLTELVNNSGLNITVKSLNESCDGDYPLIALEVHNGKSKLIRKGDYIFYVVGRNAYLICYTGNETNPVLPETYNGGLYEVRPFAFAENTNLKSVTVSGGATKLGEGTFYKCTNLENVIIGKNVGSIALTTLPFYPTLDTNGTFEYCSALKSITVDSTNSTYHSVNDCLIETNSKTLICGCKNSILPNDGSITSIADGAFFSCSGLKSIAIPESVTKIGGFAFCECTNMTGITFGKALTEIGDYAFHAAGVIHVELPDGVTSIGDNAFSYCSALESVNLGKSIDRVSRWGFQYCRKLKTVIIPEGVTLIDGWAFDSCYSLESVVIPKTVTRVDESAFGMCDKLRDVYYTGSLNQWNLISFGYNNEYAIDIYHTTVHLWYVPPD